MFTRRPLTARRLAVGLLAVGALLSVVGPIWEARRRGPETAVRAYLAAVERGEVDAALETISPERRAALAERVALQRTSTYQVAVLALGTPSVLARAGGADGAIARATLHAVVTNANGDRYPTTSTVDLVEHGGRWYLLEPPFA